MDNTDRDTEATQEIAVVQPGAVVTGDNLRGIVEAAPSAQTGGRIPIRMGDGRQLLIAPELLEAQADGGYRLTVSRAELARLAVAPMSSETVVIPVIAETLDVSTRVVETGRVRVTKRVHEREEVVDEPLLREQVFVERVPVGQYVESAPAPRQEGDTLIVPLLEEVLVVEKRLLLKEELHIRKQSVTVREPQSVTLRSEEAVVERVPGDAPTESL